MARALNITYQRPLALLAVLLAALSLGGCGINTIPTYEQNAKAKWSEVLNQYKRRSDLIPNLVESVKGFADQERNVLTQVQNQFGTDVISQYEYTSDELAQRTSMTTSGTAFDPAPPTISPSTATYTTNNLNQYTSIQYPASSIQLTYDLDGNLTNDETFQYEGACPEPVEGMSKTGLSQPHRWIPLQA